MDAHKDQAMIHCRVFFFCFFFFFSQFCEVGWLVTTHNKPLTKFCTKKKMADPVFGNFFFGTAKEWAGLVDSCPLSEPMNHIMGKLGVGILPN